MLIAQTARNRLEVFLIGMRDPRIGKEWIDFLANLRKNNGKRDRVFRDSQEASELKS